MPGIAGLITKLPRSIAEPQLLKMVQSMRHDPSCRSGTWIDESLGIYVGWTTRPGSFSCEMPLCSESGDLTLIFSGEEFPEPGTAGRLKHRGHAVEPAGPSYLVHLAEESQDFPVQLNGRFHGLLVRRIGGEAVLFNDRFGMHRLYMHAATDAFYFAAEAKAILGVCPGLRKMDTQGLGEFIALGCTIENRTLFSGISLLPPGAAWKFSNAALCRRETYFTPSEWEEQQGLGAEEYYSSLRETFPRILSRYFQGGEKIAMSLTGGLDSRMILAWHRPGAGSLPFYSFGGIYRDSQDVIMARKIAAACGQDFHLIPVAREFLNDFPQYAERTVFLTDGSVEVKRSPDLYVSERAAAIAPVRMSGNYGGEVLRHVCAFKPSAMAPGLFHPDILDPMRRAAESYQAIRTDHPLSFFLFRQMPWYLQCSLGLEQTQLSLRSPYLDNELVRLVYRAPFSSLSNDSACLRLIEDGSRSLSRIRTDLGVGGNLPAILASLQRAFLKFTFKAEYAYDYGMPQAVARIDHALSHLHLERLFLGRHKFYHFRVWYRDALAGYVREMLLDSRSLSRPYVSRAGVEKVVGDHLRGNRNHTTEIHRLLTLELAHRLFVDTN